MKRAAILVTLYFCLTLSVYAKDALPSRIVSLGPTITEKVYLLGAEDRVVGVTTYCERPAPARQKEKVGSVTQANVEKITALKPDLVLATSLTDRKAVMRLKQLGFRLVVFPEPGTYAEMNKQFLELAVLIGKERQAGKMIRDSEEKVETIRKRVQNLSKPKVFVQIGVKPIFTATRNSFLNDFIEFAGAINIARDAGSGFYSRELVLTQNPDVIILIAMEAAAENEKKVWQRFTTINAVKQNRIFVMDSYRTCSPTPVTFVEALAEIVQLVHPGA